MKSIWADSVFYFFTILIHRAINFCLVFFYVSNLSPDEYGTFELFISICTFLAVFIGLELYQGCGRLFSEVTDLEKNTIFSMCFFTILLCSFVFILANYLGLFSNLWKYIFETRDLSSMTLAGALHICAFSLFAFLQIQLKWEFRRIAFLLATATPILIYLLIVIYFIFFSTLTIEILVWGNFFLNILGCSLCIIMLRHRFCLNFNFNLYKQVFSFSLPLIPSGILLIAILISDRLMLDWLLERSDVGEYSFGYRVANIAVFAYAGIQSALAPLVMKSLSNENFSDDFSRVFHIFLFYSHIFIFGLLIFIPSIISNIVDISIYQYTFSLIIFLVPALFLSQMYIFFPGPVIAKKNEIYLLVNFVSLIINLCANLFFIPLFGVIGAALATFLTYAINILLLAFLTRQIFLPRIDKAFLSALSLCWLVIFFAWFEPSIKIYDQSIIYKLSLYLFLAIFVVRYSKLPFSVLTNNLRKWIN